MFYIRLLCVATLVKHLKSLSNMFMVFANISKVLHTLGGLCIVFSGPCIVCWCFVLYRRRYDDHGEETLKSASCKTLISASCETCGSNVHIYIYIYIYIYWYVHI